MNPKKCVFQSHSSQMSLERVFNDMKEAGFKGSRGISLFGRWYPRNNKRNGWDVVKFLPLAFFKHAEDEDPFVMHCYGIITDAKPKNKALPHGTPAVLIFENGETYELRLSEAMQLPK